MITSNITLKWYKDLNYYPVIYSIALSFNGQLLAIGTDSEHQIELYNVETATYLKTFVGHTDYVTSVDFSPNGELIASGSHDNSVKLWEVSTGKLIETFVGHSEGVISVDFSPNGELIASGSHDNSVKLWEVSTGKLIETFIGHSNLVSSIAFSPNGELIASGSYDNSVKLWEVSTGKLIETFVGHSEGVISVDFSPNGELIASGSHDESVKVWEVGNNSASAITLTQYDATINSVVFKDEQLLFSSSFRGVFPINLWDVKNKQVIQTISGKVDEIEAIALSKDGKILACCGNGLSSTIEVWEVAITNLV